MTTINLADPELELIDPTPNVQLLFIQFDKIFFWTKLASRAVVRWSKRMYSCAGVCSYEGWGGLCDIALSEPLLKLRPRKDLVETLLHEMIHAFLFITCRVQDRDGHGPNFQAHMHRINKSAGLNITIYHDFHDEVRLYQTHWWRCNGPCQKVRPHFGIVRRSMNRAPGPSDFWWNQHQQKCGGTFIKIKEPENKKPAGKKAVAKTNTVKPNADITKYINNNNNNNVPNSNKTSKPPVLKDSNINTINSKTKSNSPNTFVIGKKGVGFNPIGVKSPPKPVPIFTGNGHILNNKKELSDSKNVTEHVRNIWANKQIPTAINKTPIKKPYIKEPGKNITTPNSSKHKHKGSNDIPTPPAKIKKIDDYFKATTALKDLYGDDFKLTQPQDGTKLVAVEVKKELVDCPICSAQIDSKDINTHLDECLNKEIIEDLTQNNQIVQEVKPSQSNNDNNKIGLNNEQIPAPATTSPSAHKDNQENNLIDLTNLSDFFDFDDVQEKGNTDKPATTSVSIPTKSPIIQISNEKDKSLADNLVTKERGDEITNTNRVRKSRTSDEPKTDTIEAKPGTSKDSDSFEQICPCCGNKCDKPFEQHLDECLAFFDNNTTIPEEGSNTSIGNMTTIVIDDEDDAFDESLVFNATGTKSPCPCCMKMVEQAAMNDHLDVCLGLV